ncbi:MAG TPA: prolyl oligopeptidase family serine peptidase [Chthoniobacterales bacterium]|nr:prolyl oligopeptidase family serine peptidase [Chthoniobacterales bacterium]
MKFAKISLLVWLGLIGAQWAVAVSPRLEPAPETKKEPVKDSYYGITISDDYRWLEDLKNPEVGTWAQKQSQRAEKFLAALPGRAAIADEVRKLISTQPISYGDVQLAAGKTFARKFDPKKQQPSVVVLDAADRPESERPICDPNVIDSAGKTAVDWFVPSPDGKLIAVSLSKSGSEDGDLYFFSVADGKQSPEVLKHVQYPTAGGSAAWTKDSSGIFYTRFPREGERPASDLHFYQQVYFHRLGTNESEDTYSIGKDFPKIAEVQLESVPDSDFIVATVENGDGGDFEHFVLGPEKTWKQLTRFEDKIKRGRLGAGGSFYAISVADAPRGKIVKFDLNSANGAEPAVIVPQGEGVVEDLALTPERLLVHTLVGGPSELQVYRLNGGEPTTAPIAPVSSVMEVVTTTQGSSLVLVETQSYTETPRWLQLNLQSNQFTPTALSSPAPVSFADIEVTRDFAVSKDGTKVPLNILHKKETTLDGNNPTILYGYGGYGVNEEPRVRIGLRAWFDRGGIFVDTNLRGGGEFGEAWHKAGNLTKKQNVFDDFAACADYLIQHKYTSPSKLGMLGGSNGGLLMGAMITQHPTLMKAVVSEVGIYDSLRSELEPNGMFNTTEFGTVKDPEQFKALYAYSPYHHIKDGQGYPAILLTAGLNDGRVAAHNSFKFAARLQAEAAPGSPVLLRVSSFGHGHGSSLDERIADFTNLLSFFAYELGATENTAVKR